MKRLTKVFISAFMALLMATILPLQVMASTPVYISEILVLIDEGKIPEGYAVLSTDDNIYVNLNRGAGGGEGSKGDKSVYLCYKTTKNRDEAITDLAVMNMRGGYSTDDYDALMETNIKEQILPFIRNFVVSLVEYRNNYNSKSKANKQRAQFVHDVLNKLVDDDTGKYLGDLLLNETKEELGKEEYEKLSPEEKKNHASLTTILTQANGRATLVMENMIAKACDTNSDSWADRFSKTTYEDLINATGKSPTDARKYLAKLYDDDACIILDSWNKFNEQLATYNECVEYVEDFDEEAVMEIIKAYEDADEDEKKKLQPEYDKACEALLKFTESIQIIECHDYLESIEYSGATLLEFFSKSDSEISEDITVLYPMVAALSDGQRATLEFLSIKELVMIADSTKKGYDDGSLKEFEAESIYKGVDRDIYKKGGVGLTSDAIRNNLSPYQQPDVPDGTANMILTYIGFGCFFVAVGLGAKAFKSYLFAIHAKDSVVGWEVVQSAYRTSRICAGLCAAFTIAAIVLMALFAYLSHKEMEDYYKTKFTPIPRYMVDEKDITGYNRKGEKIVIKNQAAYYKAVKCNRTAADEKYSEIGEFADLNGDVGAQWLALYAASNSNEQPILADSLIAVVNDKDVPAGYQTGIHMFGSDVAFNLNTYPYDWNKSAPSVMVYFKRDDTPQKTAANFTGGMLALASGGGILLGAVITMIGITLPKKKEEKK